MKTLMQLWEQLSTSPIFFHVSTFRTEKLANSFGFCVIGQFDKTKKYGKMFITDAYPPDQQNFPGKVVIDVDVDNNLSRLPAGNYKLLFDNTSLVKSFLTTFSTFKNNRAAVQR